MTTLVVVLRLVSVLALAGLVLLAVSGRGGGPRTAVRRSGRERAPLVANLAAVGLYLPALVVFSECLVGVTTLLLASVGSLVAVAGAALVIRSRAELGAAWSLVPMADEGAGLVTSGPYRVVRHPIYLGFVLLAMGEALAFGSWPALTIVWAGMVPTFAWRARAEEKLLGHTFGERYAAYRARTRLMIPYLL